MFQNVFRIRSSNLLIQNLIVSSSSQYIKNRMLRLKGDQKNLSLRNSLIHLMVVKAEFILYLE